MQRSGRLAVYVTSHGFGHLNRTVAVLNLLPADVPLTIRCHPNLFDHWGERLRRPADLEPHVSDAGAVNPDGNSAVTDGRATLALARRVHAEALARVDEEADRLRAGATAAVLCDIPPVPLIAAARAGIPGFALGNFTWAEIYAEHAEAVGDPEELRFVDELRSAYSHATALFRLEPGLPMTEFARQIEVGMVVTPGRDRRAELRSLLGVGPGARLVYVYVGRYGQSDLPWHRLETFRGTHFIGFHRPSGQPPANLHVVPADSWTGSDLMASCDAALAKAGYGTACEAMASGTPLIYPHRTGFAEHAALDRALQDWGGGYPLEPEPFAALELGETLERAFSQRPGPPPFPADGARRVAESLARVCRGLAFA